MRRSYRKVVGLVAGLMVVGLLTSEGAVAAPESPSSMQSISQPRAGAEEQAAPEQEAAAERRAARRVVDCRPGANPRSTRAPRVPMYLNPKDGVLRLNNPQGNRAARRANTALLLRAIHATPSCGKIQIATWNLRSRETARALRIAMQRGVTVRITIASGNDGPRGSETFNKIWRDLDRAATRVNRAYIRAGADPRPDRNAARTCARACRYAGGAAHSKYYLFSSVMRNRSSSKARVTIFGSHNATGVAATNQWNDLMIYTRPALYRFLERVFNQSLPKQNQRNPYRRVGFGNLITDIYPYVGRGRTQGSDPMMAALNRVRCTGAGAAGKGNRTTIRVAVSAILNQRGIALSRKLARLKRAGCDVRVVTTNVGFQALRVLRAHNVPVRQLAVYNENLGKYTTYLHTKFMTINGHYNGRPNRRVAFNGSANWTAAGLVSDELVGQVADRRVVVQYTRAANRWFARANRNVRPTTNAAAERRAGAQDDVWSLIEQDF